MYAAKREVLLKHSALPSEALERAEVSVPEEQSATPTQSEEAKEPNEDEEDEK